ncbi:MAG: hypothetical protein ACI9B8_002454 [Sulfitobacter sp.]|jgi:hypothetical protein
MFMIPQHPISNAPDLPDFLGPLHTRVRSVVMPVSSYRLGVAPTDGLPIEPMKHSDTSTITPTFNRTARHEWLDMLNCSRLNGFG